ncbi:cytochrome P450 [Daldinia sp. FL1419]|nr:cytochrome P450 [Daldinia sp. FL1419]
MVTLLLLSSPEGSSTYLMIILWFFLLIDNNDTITPTLAFALYELSRSPWHQDILLSELKGVDIYDKSQLQNRYHLTALINETLGLYPPVPTGGYRQSPPTGMNINGVYIPGNVTMAAPRYSLPRLDSSYEGPDQFIPERWTTRPEMVKDARGFAPFSQGRFNCIGKNLAMTEMRFAVALLVKK